MRANRVSRPIEIRVAVAPDATVRWIVRVEWTKDALPDMPDRGEYQAIGTTIAGALNSLGNDIAADAAAALLRDPPTP